MFLRWRKKGREQIEWERVGVRERVILSRRCKDVSLENKADAATLCFHISISEELQRDLL